jgi:UDP-N-acetylmuramoyl-tripeptide--D-alanyl-D-alanine ligase
MAPSCCRPHPRARLVGDGATPLARVHTDTPHAAGRRPVRGPAGERFDANTFCPGRRGRRRGRHGPGGLQAAGLPGIEVPDTLRRWARWRRLARQLDLPLIAVTGSNGKTTVTQMIAAILRAQGEAALATAATSTTTSACR